MSDSWIAVYSEYVHICGVGFGFFHSFNIIMRREEIYVEIASFLQEFFWNGI